MARLPGIGIIATWSSRDPIYQAMLQQIARAAEWDEFRNSLLKHGLIGPRRSTQANPYAQFAAPEAGGPRFESHTSALCQHHDERRAA
jgi:hypothetical protein